MTYSDNVSTFFVFFFADMVKLSILI